jgi:DMSO/TMAO reductase YedYZ molybdopterin-dependent catalytic subunit
MNEISRRRLIKTGLAAAGGVAGLAVADRLAKRYGLIPPDGGGCYGPGETLTYAAQRVLLGDRQVREFPRSMISKAPFANEAVPVGDWYKRSQAAGFADWRLVVDGMVDRPLSLSLGDIKCNFPMRSQITEIGCEEGWTYIAEWIGTPLHHVLRAAGMQPKARWVVYYAADKVIWESIDMNDALHPQTLLTYGMNDGDLPEGFGGPLRLRLPRQLGYKSVKYVIHMTATDDIKKFGKGLGSIDPEGGYAWYAGI